MKVGFTGTRIGMSAAQHSAFRGLIVGAEEAFSLGIDHLFYDHAMDRNKVSAFHHGDCIGADDEAANEIEFLRENDSSMRGISIISHPPVDPAHRAYNKHADVTLEPKTHFARNRDIVNDTDMLIATPRHDVRPAAKTGGGTWYTIEHAEKVGKRVIIIWPNGNVDSQFDCAPPSTTPAHPSAPRRSDSENAVASPNEAGTPPVKFEKIESAQSSLNETNDNSAKDLCAKQGGTQAGVDSGFDRHGGESC